MPTTKQPIVPQGSYPKPSRGTIVVCGMLASAPFGGMVWQVYHYLVPLRRLGFDTWYVEDSDRLLFDPVTYNATEDFSANVELLARFMRDIGFEDRWVFGRPSADGACVGAKDRKGLDNLYRQADAILNLCGAQEPQDVYSKCGCLVYVETDPGQKQVDAANGIEKHVEELAAHHHLFSYGENLGAEDCLIPVEGYSWLPTRPPVCMDLWENAEGAPAINYLTSVANWKHKGKDVVWKGESWRWSKHHEFLKFKTIPQKSALQMQLAVGAISDEERKRLEELSWKTIPSSTLDDPAAYRRFIQGSLGEFTVAKEQYVRPRSGWFSDRSVCYLAAGRPVVTQDTAFGKFIPTGSGLFAYQTMEQALDAIEAIASDYDFHSRAAGEIANEYFGAERVISELLEKIGIL